MKYAIAICTVALLFLSPLRTLFASDSGFDAAVAAIEQQYHPQQPHVPLQWLASLCATVSTGGGVRHMRIADFPNVKGLTTPNTLAHLISSHLSSAWSQMVLSRDSPEDFSVIYIRPDHNYMRMLVVSYDHGEIDLVRMDLNGERLAHFVQDPAHTATHQNTIPD